MAALSKAANYYFSNSLGDDSRSSLAAQNRATPWKSLNKLNSFFSQLQPGDSVLFKRGENFNGFIVISTSGTKAKPIVVAAYGKGSKPVINGLTKLSNWVATGNGIFECYNAALGASVGTVLIDGVAKAMGRYPNDNTKNKGYLTIDAYTGNTSITDNLLSSTPNWTGAEVVMRKSRWKIDRSLITAHIGNTIQYKSGAPDDAKLGYGYFIQNSINTLNQFGEWYYDPASKKMHIYFGKKLPGAHTIAVSIVDNIITAHNASYVVLKELALKGAGEDGINISGGNRIAVLNCDILYSGKIGIEIKDNTDCRIDQCLIRGSDDGGINVSANHAMITHNKVKNTGLFPGMGVFSGSGFTAITCNSEKGLIENNEITNTGYIGILFKKDSCSIKNNVVDSFCMTTDDGGGIYTYNGENITNYNRIIDGNIINHGIGAPEGTNSINSSADGIYLDDDICGVEVKNNTVANCNKGLFLHNTRDIVVTNNTFFNNNIQAYAKHDDTGGAIRNVLFENNILFSKFQGQPIWSFVSKTDDIKNFGEFENNYYQRPVDDSVIISTTYSVLGQSVTAHLDLKGWANRYGNDQQTKQSPAQIPPYSIKSFIDVNKFGNGTFTNNMSGVWANNCTLAWKNTGLLDQGYLQVVPSKYGASVTMGVGELMPTKTYILKFSIIGNADYKSIAAFLRYGGSPYAAITPVQYRTFTTARTEHEMILTPSVYQKEGTLVFTCDGLDTYALDNIQLYEADVNLTNPDKYIRFEYNSSGTRKVILLDEPYVDSKGNLFNNKLVLQPYTSAILIKKSPLYLENITPIAFAK